jgi:hypothetical protein
MSGNPSRQQPPSDQTPAASLLNIRVKRKQEISPSGKAGDLTQGQAGAAAGAPTPMPMPMPMPMPGAPAAAPVTSPVEALRRREAAQPTPASPSLPPSVMREAFASKPVGGKATPQSPLAAKPMSPMGDVKPAAPAPQPPVVAKSPLNGATPPSGTDDLPRENKAAAFLRDAPTHRVTAPPAPVARESKPSEPPADSKPVDAKPFEAKPLPVKPVDAKPVEAKAFDAKPADSKPADAKPADAKSGDAKLPEAKPLEAKASEVKAPEAKTPEAKAAEPRDVKAHGSPAAAPPSARDLPPWHGNDAPAESKPAAAAAAAKPTAAPQPPTTATGPTTRLEPPPLSDKLPESKPVESKPAESKPAATQPTPPKAPVPAPAAAAQPAPEPPRPAAAKPGLARRTADEIIDYWDGMRGGRDFPSLSELDRTMIAACWPNSVLLAFGQTEPPMPKISRIGEPNSEVEYTAMVTDWILSRGGQSVKRGEPMEEEQRFPVSTGMARYRLILLPFASQGPKADHVLCHLARIEDLSPAAAFKRWLTS